MIIVGPFQLKILYSFFYSIPFHSTEWSGQAQWKGGNGFSDHRDGCLPSHFPPFQLMCLVCAEKQLWIWGNGKLRESQSARRERKTHLPAEQGRCQSLVGWAWLKRELPSIPAPARDSPACGARVTLM